MKNLENYGVQSLNAKEIRETEGGGPLPISTGQTSNSISYAGQAIYNGFAYFANFAYDAWWSFGSAGGSPPSN